MIVIKITINKCMYVYWKGNLRVADLQTPKMAERRPEYLQSNKITGKNRFLMVD